MSEINETAESITLWTYPIGGWGDRERIRPLLDAFTAETGIGVQVEVLSYDKGDRQMASVLGTEAAPDLVMEGPERLVAEWGMAGAMEDLRDMLDDGDRGEIHRSVLSACTAPDGSVYLYPLGRTVHCMAINVDAFRQANALQYVNLRKHTWTTEQFFQAVAALSSHFRDDVGAVYCGGQAGDQGTRALVSNLYGGSLTDDAHTRYTWNDPLIVQALEELRKMNGIYFDPYLTGGEEIDLFYKGKLKMAFCWNISRQLTPNADGTAVGRTSTGQEIAFMAFPSPKGVPHLAPGIWGFGILRGKDPAKVAAAKAFIRFMCDSDHTREAVQIANHFATRTAVGGKHLPNIWGSNELMREYNTILPYIGENNQLVKGWRKARTAWWNMLQMIGAGGDIEALTARYAREANEAAQ